MNKLSSLNTVNQSESNYQNISNPVTVVPSKKPQVKNANGTVKVQTPLCERNLNLGINECGQAVREEIKNMALVCLNGANTILPANQRIIYKEKDSLETTIWKTTQGALKLDAQQVRMLADKDPLIIQPGEEEVKYNAFLSWMSYIWICSMPILRKDDRKIFNGCKMKSDGKDIIEGIDSLLDELIQQLEATKQKCYLPAFTIIMNTNLSCEKKSQFAQSFFGNVFLESSDDLFKRLVYCGQKLMLPMTKDFHRLQLLLECFNKMKAVPKIFYNMNKGCNFLNYSYDLFNKDLPLMNKRKNKNKGSESYYSYFSQMCVYLYQGKEKYRGLLEQEQARIKMVDKPANKFVQNQKGQQPKKKNLQVKSQEIPDVGLETPKDNKDKSEAILVPSKGGQETSSKIDFKKVEELKNVTESKDVKTQTVREEIKQKGFDFNEPAVYIEEGDQDQIAEEADVLVKLMLRLYPREGDRKEKTRIKEEKTRQKSLQNKAEVEEKESVNVDRKPEFIKLNSTQEETLMQLLKDKPPHYAISGEKVKDLYEAYDGIVKGVEGSKYHIFWLGNNNTVGGFEVAHDKGERGFLTSEYAKKAAKPLKEAIESGKIMLDPALIEKIEQENQNNPGNPIVIKKDEGWGVIKSAW